MKKCYIFLLLTIFIFSSNNIKAIIDNRFLPLYRRKFDHYCDKRSVMGSNLFFLFADKANGIDGKEVGLPEINGKYDLTKISKALEKTKGINPLNDAWQPLLTLVMDLEGKLDGQGFWVGYEQSISKNFSIGISWFILNVVNRQEFIITNQIKRELKLSVGSEIEFDRNLRRANDLLGLERNEFNTFGSSDIDLYLRFGTVREYCYKFKKIDLGLTFGTLFPVDKADINNPVSLSLGGNGHWGFYGMIDSNFELKEDLNVGFWLQFCKRLPKTSTQRMPVNNEPVQFGAIQGLAKVDPGLTIGFSPFIRFADIRDGFGFEIRYTGVWHFEDEWSDLRTNPKVKTTLNSVMEKSSWNAEYVTFSWLFDFNKTIKARKFAPLVYLDWDMPVRQFIGKDSARTNRVSLGFEINF